MLEHYANNPPSTGETWFGPWNSILYTLFPYTNYLICPQRRIGANHDLIYKIARARTPAVIRTVLIVNITVSMDFERGKDLIMQRIQRKAQKAFERTAVQKVYWIGVIGPNWIYGEMEDGQNIMPLIEWHHVTHDDASYQDFLELVELVGTLEVGV